MNHSELQDCLFDWRAGRLARSEADRVAAHVPACQECHAQLNAWTQTAALVFTPLKSAGPQPFTQAVMRKIRLSEENAVRPRFFSRWAFPALALSLGSFAIVFLYVLEPASVAADGLFLTDQQVTASEWLNDAAQDDQLLASVAEKS